MNTHSSITLELNASSVLPITLEAHRGDINSRFIDVSLTSNGVAVPLTSAMSAVYDATVSEIIVADGLTGTINTSTGVITLELTKAMLSLAGVMKIDIKVKEGASLITAQTFRVRVARSVIDENSRFEPQGKTIQEQLDKKADNDKVYLKADADKRFLSKQDAENTYAEKADSLDGYGIKNAYTKAETDAELAKKATKATTLSGYGITNSYTKTESDLLLKQKSDRATTLSGYGITDAYTKGKADSRFGLNVSVLFDSRLIPLKLTDTNSISTGFATGNTAIVSAYISSNVTTIDSGSFSGCTALTDIYIDNTEGKVTIKSGAIPDTVTVHYTDEFNANSRIFKALCYLKELIDSRYTKAETDTLLTQKENSENKVSDVRAITDPTVNYPSIDYLDGYYYKADEIDSALGEKADSTDVNLALSKKADLVRSNNLVCFKDSIFEKNGITLEISKNHFKVKGTATGYTALSLQLVEGSIQTFEGEHNYCVSVNNYTGTQSTYESMYLYGVYSADDPSKYAVITFKDAYAKTICPNENKAVSIRFTCNAGQTFDMEFDFMIEDGTKSTGFVPFLTTGDILGAKSVHSVTLDDGILGLINGKYDGSNITTGAGTLTPDEASQPYINYSDYAYERIGNFVIIHFRITIKSTLNEAITFNLSGLPFVCKLATSVLCYSSQNNIKNVRVETNTSTLKIYNEKVLLNETITPTLIYRIN